MASASKASQKIEFIKPSLDECTKHSDDIFHVVMTYPMPFIPLKCYRKVANFRFAMSERERTQSSLFQPRRTYS